MEEVKCKVCNQMFSLTETFCPECGFERHIYPEPISTDLEKYEEERVNKYKEQKIKKEEELKKQEDAFNKVSSQLSEARDTLKKSEEKLTTAEAKRKSDREEIDRLTSELKQANNNLSSAQVEQEKLLTELNELSGFSKKNEELIKQIAQLESAAKIVEAQRKDLVERLNKTNDSLTKEIEDHKKTKALLEQQNTRIQMHTDDSSDNPRLQPLLRPIHGQQQGKPAATIIFSFRGQSVQENVFEGDNIYAIPSNMTSPVSGDAFRIESMNSKTFRLYDLCGLTRKVNGDRLGTTGMQLYNDDYFSVGDITIQIKIQKINLRDMLI